MDTYRAAMCAVLLGVAALAGTTLALADPPQAPPITRDMREKLARLHEHMAACLRSDKPIAECRHEMMQGCYRELGAHECPMMGMGMGHGMMGMPGMMHGAPDSSAPRQ